MTKKGARALVSRAVIVVALVFIVTSVSQIIIALFVASPPKEPATSADVACGERLRVLAVALERAGDHAGRAADEVRARATFEASIAPEWNEAGDAERACASSPRGKDAWSALLRLRRTLEGRAEKDAREVAPVRRDFETRLP